MAVTDDARQLLKDRLAELEPLVEEYERIERMVAALDGHAPPTRAAMARRTTAERKAEILEIIRDSPGIRVKDVAARIGLTVPRVVQLVNALESDGSVERTRDGLHPHRT